MLKFDIEQNFEESYLLADDEHTSYKLYKCVDEDGDVYLVKLWEKIFDQSVKEIWLQEIRQLIFLKNSPNAEKYLLIIDDAKEYEDCFVTTYKIKIDEIDYETFYKKNTNWNSKGKLRDKELRFKIWGNLKNIAEGLNLLHENGFLHRSINTKSIIVNIDDEIPSDFKLTGFEWMLELGRFNYNKKNYGVLLESSYNNDWMDYLRLAEEIFNIKKIKEIDEIFTRKEVYFFYKHMSSKKINDEDILNDLDEILQQLDVQEENSTEYYLHIIARKEDDFLGEINKLIEGVDHGNIIEFIKSDINKLNKVGMLKALHYKQGVNKYFIQGEKFLYNIEKSKNFMGVYTTDKMVLIDIYQSIPFYAKHEKEFKEFDIVVDVGREKNKKNDWSRLLSAFKNKIELDENVKNFINSILISQAIDIADYYSQIYSVEVVDILEDKEKIKVKLNTDLQSEAINRALCKKTVSECFNKFYRDNPDVEWIISNVKPENKREFYSAHGEDNEDFRYRLFSSGFNKNYEYFLDSKIDSENPEKISEVVGKINQHMFMYPKSLLGNHSSLLRKNKAITLLVKNTNLLNSLIFPKKNTKIYNSKLQYVDGYQELDDSKKEVFEKALNTYPNYIVQGPPGVGKTFLVKTLVEQIFKNEPFSKIVLSAQSHSTVEVLSDEIDKCEFEKKLVMIKAFNNSDHEAKSIISNTLLEHLEPVYISKLWKESYSTNIDLRQDMDKFKHNKENYNFYDKILSSANIILTTTNSKTIEKMLDNNCYFDWSIMEEAAKASTNDLISPLLLSYKRLLIGDHKQLPPFFEKDFKKIMVPENLNLDKIISFITKGKFKNSIVHDSGLYSLLEIFTDIKPKLNDDDADMDELLKFVQDKYLPAIEKSIEYYSLFKYLFKEVDINKSNKSKINFGSMISEQYRMHPDISKIITKVFYDYKLLDNESRKVFYLDDCNRPFYFKDFKQVDLENSKRFTWLNVKEPYSDSSVIKILEENFVNKSEVLIIEDILNCIYKKSNFIKKPSIVLLSPYAKQVNYINEYLKTNGVLKELIRKDFEIISENEICKTCDSFQGGEADLVIISLVRNNINNDIYSALGFLIDERRMNVMFSRAKFHLIIVGSIGMFDYWVNSALNHKELPIEAAFIEQLIKLVRNPQYCTFHDASTL